MTTTSSSTDDWVPATPHRNYCGDCDHEWRSMGAAERCPSCDARLDETGGTSTDLYERFLTNDGDPEEDPVAAIELELLQRLCTGSRDHPFTDVVEEITGEDLPEQWAGEYVGGGYDDRGYRWAKQRERALERDQHRCQVCGTPNDVHRQYYGQGLNVHHIVPLDDVDAGQDPHHLGNLITLCIQCHTDHEGLGVDELREITEHDDWLADSA